MKLNITAILSVAALLCAGVNASLSESDKSTLLSRHRSARNSVGASDMKSLSWSDKLAKEAQNYANSCPGLNHSSNRNGEGENISVGDVSITALFDSWISEKSAFLKSGYASNFKGVSYNGKTIGHYSQIVWADNTSVGCGIANCSGGKNLICRYGTGNIIGQRVYTSGGGEKKETPKSSTVKKTTTTIRKPTTTKPVTQAPVSAKTVQNPKPVLTATVNTKVPLSTVAPNTPATGPAGKPANKNAGNPKNKNDNTKDSSSTPSNNNEIIDGVNENKKGSSAGAVVTSMAVTGIGAFAAFAFVKKNPKQYQQIKRNLSRSATSVKRGASVVTRKLTIKRGNTIPVQNETTDAVNTNYRVEFADTMQV